MAWCIRGSIAACRLAPCCSACGWMPASRRWCLLPSPSSSCWRSRRPPVSAAARAPRATRSGFDVGVAFLPLQAADFGDAGWHHGGFRQHLVLADAAAHQGVVTDAELHFARSQFPHDDVVGIAVLILFAL